MIQSLISYSHFEVLINYFKYVQAELLNKANGVPYT